MSLCHSEKIENVIYLKISIIDTRLDEMYEVKYMVLNLCFCCRWNPMDAYVAESQPIVDKQSKDSLSTTIIEPEMGISNPSQIISTKHKTLEDAISQIVYFIGKSESVFTYREGDTSKCNVRSFYIRVARGDHNELVLECCLTKPENASFVVTETTKEYRIQYFSSDDDVFKVADGVLKKL